MPPSLESQHWPVARTVREGGPSSQHRLVGSLRDAILRDATTLREGERIMVVCNACRYCEGYCAVFPAMEKRLTFPAGDLHYLANLCHNCGECLYACQYAPPHEFAINVPRTLAQLRLQSYEEYAWPGPLSRAFRRHSVAASLALSIGMTAVMLLVTAIAGNIDPAAAPGAFYSVLPHYVMVALFGTVFTFVLAALAVGLTRFRHDARSDAGRPGHSALATVGSLCDPTKQCWPGGPHCGPPPADRRSFSGGWFGPGSQVAWSALRDVLTLRYLHARGADCTYAGEEARSAWRRWFHHFTFYGFLLCFAATSIAAIYHLWFGWEAPYAYTSVPVVLGTTGGLGLVVGPAGLYWIGRTRDPDTADPAERSLDHGFLLLLLLTSLTGLVLLALRETAAMPPLLIVHLGVVLALFVTLPYSKFVHGVYRAAALVKYALEAKHTSDT